MLHGHLCPFCHVCGSKLFGGGFFNGNAIDYVSPSGMVGLARQVLFCNNKACPNSRGFGGVMLSRLYCPECSTWRLQLDHCANEGWGFKCPCGFMFGVIN